MWRPTIPSDEIWHSALSHSAKGTHWKNHKYIRIENDRYIYDSNKGKIKSTPEQHQQDLEKYYQDWKYYHGSLNSIHDSDPEFVEYRKRRQKEDEAKDHPWLADTKNKLETANNKVNNQLNTIGKKVSPLTSELGDVGREAGKLYVQAAKKQGEIRNRRIDTFVKGTKDAYDSVTPIVAEAADKRKKKKKRGGSSGSF